MNASTSSLKIQKRAQSDVMSKGHLKELQPESSTDFIAHSVHLAEVSEEDNPTKTRFIPGTAAGN